MDGWMDGRIDGWMDGGRTRCNNSHWPDQYGILLLGVGRRFFSFESWWRQLHRPQQSKINRNPFRTGIASLTSVISVSTVVNRPLAVLIPALLNRLVYHPPVPVFIIRIFSIPLLVSERRNVAEAPRSADPRGRKIRTEASATSLIWFWFCGTPLERWRHSPGWNPAALIPVLIDYEL